MFDLTGWGDRVADRARDLARDAAYDTRRNRDRFDKVAGWGERTIDRQTDYLRERVVDALEPVYELVERVIEYSKWVLETVRVVYPVPFYRFIVAGDERTCPECGAWHGATWEDGFDLVSPPLHVNCRCQVIHAWTEWRVRYVDEWRLRWFSRSEFEWRITGWA